MLAASMTTTTTATGAVVDFIQTRTARRFSCRRSDDRQALHRRRPRRHARRLDAGRGPHPPRPRARHGHARPAPPCSARGRSRRARPSAALVNGTSGHALDWDDTQLATSADRIFGLLTHPTMPPLVAALAVGEPRQHLGRAVPRGVPDGLRGRVQDRRGDPPESLQEGLPLVGHDRHVRRRGRRGEAARARRGADGAHARDRRELGVRHPRQLRHHDEAAARRPRGAERRHWPRSSRRAASRAARTRSIRRGASSRCSATAKASIRRASFRRARQPAHDRLARRVDQAVPVRRARPSDDGRDAPAGAEARREARADRRDPRARRLEHPEPAALSDRDATSSRRSSAPRSWSARSRCAARPASTSSTTSSCRARRCRR